MSKKTLYTQPGCSQCKAVHMLLDKKKITYEECNDITTMKNKGITHTPALEIDGKILQGKAIFDFANSYKGE